MAVHSNESILYLILYQFPINFIVAVFQPVSVTLISDPISPLGVAGSNVTVMCTAELNSAIDVPVNTQIWLTGPDGGALATTNGTPRPRSMAYYTINSFRREQIGVYTCTVNLSSPRLQGRVITKTIHIHVGKNEYCQFLHACAPPSERLELFIA